MWKLCAEFPFLSVKVVQMLHKIFRIAFSLYTCAIPFSKVRRRSVTQPDSDLASMPRSASVPKDVRFSVCTPAPSVSTTFPSRWLAAVCNACRSFCSFPANCNTARHRKKRLSLSYAVTWPSRKNISADDPIPSFCTRL